MPTLVLNLLDETVLGAYGSATRRRHETELVAALLQQLEPHVAAAAPRRQNQEATPLSQWDMMFHMADAATAARQGLRDEGGVQIALTGLSAPVWVVLREGPGRLPSVFVRVVVSNLPGDFMVPGAVACLLESAGYALGGDDGVVVRAEHGGEQRAAIAAFAPGVARLGVVVGIVKPPPSDPTLARLPRRLQDVDGLITINVAGLRPSQKKTLNPGLREITHTCASNLSGGPLDRWLLSSALLPRQSRKGRGRARGPPGRRHASHFRGRCSQGPW